MRSPATMGSTPPTDTSPTRGTLTVPLSETRANMGSAFDSLPPLAIVTSRRSPDPINVVLDPMPDMFARLISSAFWAGGTRNLPASWTLDKAPRGIQRVP